MIATPCRGLYTVCCQSSSHLLQIISYDREQPGQRQQRGPTAEPAPPDHAAPARLRTYHARHPDPLRHAAVGRAHAAGRLALGEQAPAGRQRDPAGDPDATLPAPAASGQAPQPLLPLGVLLRRFFLLFLLLLLIVVVFSFLHFVLLYDVALVHRWAAAAAYFASARLHAQRPRRRRRRRRLLGSVVDIDFAVFAERHLPAAGGPLRWPVALQWRWSAAPAAATADPGGWRLAVRGSDVVLRGRAWRAGWRRRWCADERGRGDGGHSADEGGGAAPEGGTEAEARGGGELGAHGARQARPGGREDRQIRTVDPRLQPRALRPLQRPPVHLSRVSSPLLLFSSSFFVDRLFSFFFVCCCCAVSESSSRRPSWWWLACNRTASRASSKLCSASSSTSSRPVRTTLLLPTVACVAVPFFSPHRTLPTLYYRHRHASAAHPADDQQPGEGHPQLPLPQGERLQRR